MDCDKVSEWLTNLLAAQEQDIFRAKGIIAVEGEDHRLGFQAVHMMLEGDFQRTWKPDEQRHSKLIFIGRNLDDQTLRASFETCAAGTKIRADSTGQLVG